MGSAFKLSGQSIPAGRSKGLLLFPNDPFVAPLHCTFFYRGDDLFLSLPQLPLLLLLAYLSRDALKKALGPEMGVFMLMVVVICLFASSTGDRDCAPIFAKCGESFGSSEVGRHLRPITQFLDESRGSAHLPQERALWAKAVTRGPSSG